MIHQRLDQVLKTKHVLLLVVTQRVGDATDPILHIHLGVRDGVWRHDNVIECGTRVSFQSDSVLKRHSL